MEIEAGPLAAYLEDLLPDRDPLLQQMEAYAREHGVPIVGPRVGTLLTILTAAHHAERALELGTAIGYSGIWIARGLAPGGQLLTVEGREDVAEVARRNFQAAGLENRVEVAVGSAHDVLPTMEGEFDLIFNDIDKEGYPAILPLCKAVLRPGGLLVTDNVLWSGRVADPADRTDSTEAIREYNRLLAWDAEMEVVILPIRDGVSVALRAGRV